MERLNVPADMTPTGQGAGNAVGDPGTPARAMTAPGSPSVSVDPQSAHDQHVDTGAAPPRKRTVIIGPDGSKR
jgi:hypothetical protein